MIDKAICQPKNAKSDRQVFVKRGVFSVAKYCENTKCSQAVDKKSLTRAGPALMRLSRNRVGPRRCQEKNVKNLVTEITNREKFSNIKIAGKIKFKGGAEEIYSDYAKSVVLIGNKKNWATGSGFFFKNNG